MSAPINMNGGGDGAWADGGWADEGAAGRLVPVSPSVREPSLWRLAQSIEALNPELARALCRSGLEAMADPVEREAWRERLSGWLDEGGGGDDGDGGDPVLVAA